MQPAWILGFTFEKVILYPHLYPLLAFDTPRNRLFKASLLVDKNSQLGAGKHLQFTSRTMLEK